MTPTTPTDTTSLRILVEAAADINSSLTFEKVFPKVAARVKALINCQLFVIMLWNEATGRLEHSFSVYFDERVDLGHKGGFPLGYGISGSAAALRRPVRVGDVERDPRYVRFRDGAGICSELAVPLLLEGRLIGVIDLESVVPDAFSEEHEQVLSALASHIAVALENARLYERVAAEERRSKLDLRRAQQIQKALLPSRPPIVPGLELGFVYAPARELGGDFYDFLRYADGRLAVAIGDVAGKGTPAALYGALAVGILRGHALQESGDPAPVVERVNEELCSTHLEERFVCLAYAVYDSQARTVELANGGFPAPYLIRGSNVQRVLQPGLALGIEEGRRYGSRRLQLERGDLLVFCTDGILEARDGAGELFGVGRLSGQLREGSELSAQGLADALLAATGEFARGNESALDDRTVVVLKVG